MDPPVLMEWRLSDRSELRKQGTSANKRVYDAHVIERNIIEFAPSRLPQEKFVYHSGKRDGVRLHTFAAITVKAERKHSKNGVRSNKSAL